MMHVLFVCTGNLCRSYAAEVVAINIIDRRAILEQYQVKSVGTGRTCGGKLPNKKMRDALEHFGFELPLSKRSIKITQTEVDWADKIVCMGAVHKRKLVEEFGLNVLTKIEMFNKDGSDVPDPHFSKDASTFENVVSHIVTRIKNHDHLYSDS